MRTFLNNTGVGSVSWHSLAILKRFNGPAASGLRLSPKTENMFHLHLLTVIGHGPIDAPEIGTKREKNGHDAHHEPRDLSRKYAIGRRSNGTLSRTSPSAAQSLLRGPGPSPSITVRSPTKAVL